MCVQCTLFAERTTNFPNSALFPPPLRYFFPIQKYEFPMGNGDVETLLIYLENIIDQNCFFFKLLNKRSKKTFLPKIKLCLKSKSSFKKAKIIPILT